MVYNQQTLYAESGSYSEIDRQSTSKVLNSIRSNQLFAQNVYDVLIYSHVCIVTSERV